MAWDIPGFSRSWIAGGTLGLAGSDFSVANTVNGIAVDSYRYMFVKFSGGLLVPITAATDAAVGVLQNKPQPGNAATVMLSGVTKVRSNDATITVGSSVFLDPFGMVTKSGTKSATPVGIAEEVAAASSGYIVAVCLKPFAVIS